MLVYLLVLYIAARVPVRARDAGFVVTLVTLPRHRSLKLPDDQPGALVTWLLG
jgi:hypothetical protein